jgi:hypothetical protein
MSTGPLPLHERFSWLNGAIQNDENAIFAEKVLAITQGAQTITSIMRNNLDDLASIADGNDTQPLMSAYEIGALAGLMFISLGTLAGDAERRINALDAAAQKGAKK